MDLRINIPIIPCISGPHTEGPTHVLSMVGKRIVLAISFGHGFRHTFIHTSRDTQFLWGRGGTHALRAQYFKIVLYIIELYNAIWLY